LSVPTNLALAAALEAVAPVAVEAGARASAADARSLAADIRSGVARDGVVDDDGEPRWAYEIDGRGGRILMDDANAPSLLSLPYLGACPADDPRYLATRRWILSPANPWWFAGAAADGIGSPHTGTGRIWPIAIAIRGLTAGSPEERIAAARMLGRTHAGTFLAHESFDPDDPARFSRSWFAWANSLVGELLERAALEGLLG
jgi:meiotically up-regulated gene 157 (Mug157) protein